MQARNTGNVRPWDLICSLPWHAFCHTNITITPKSNIRSFSGLQQLSYKAVLNTDAPLVTTRTPWDGARHATWYFVTRRCNRVRRGVQRQCVAASLHWVRSTLPWVVWQAVSVCVSAQKQNISECTRTLHSILSLWSHTHLIQMLRKTNQMKQASPADVEGTSCDWPEDITPRTHRQPAAETIWHLILPTYCIYCVAYDDASYA
jgi:hypothetical protein